jgi:hypothetical protein
VEFWLEEVETSEGPVRILAGGEGGQLLLEWEFVAAVMRLRESNEDAFALVWDLVEKLELVPGAVSA